MCADCWQEQYEYIAQVTVTSQLQPYASRAKEYLDATENRTNGHNSYERRKTHMAQQCRHRAVLSDF